MAANYTIPVLEEGMWSFEMDLGTEKLPFYCEYRAQDTSFTIINATERIVCKPVCFTGDSIYFTTPVFQNIFRLKKNSNASLEGYWYNTSKGPDYKIPVKAATTNERPSTYSLPTVSGQKWEVRFGTGDNSEPAIGVFNWFEKLDKNSSQSPMTGTFMTETGDYRFLEGKIGNGLFYLSCFDGGHAFLFKGRYNDKRDSIYGEFYSGIHHQDIWVAKRNDLTKLRNPDSITVLKPDYEGMAFNFPNLKGEMVQYPSKRFEGKVTIVEIMGSWCPNCMDQTRFMQRIKEKYESKGLEVVALCFERSADFEKSVAAVNKMRTNLGANYEFLIAGTANKNDASKVLPMLSCICSYPTTIYIDKKGKVRKIYTGFYGPSTGLYYNHYTEQTENFIASLLMEK